MKSILIFITLGFFAPTSFASLYGEKDLQIDLPLLDHYLPFPGMFGTLVTFIGNSIENQHSTFSIAVIDSAYPENFQADKAALNNFVLGLKKIGEDKGATEIKSGGISSGKWGSFQGLIFITNYSLNHQKYREAAILMPAGKTKSLSISFRSTTYDFKSNWRKVESILNQMKVHDTP